MSAQLAPLAALFVALSAALLLTSCSDVGADDPGAANGRTAHWGKGLGATEASEFMKVQVPEGAKEVKGAVQVNPQEDIYVLSFVTDEKTAVRIAEDLRPEESLRTRNHDLPPATELFGHLGLAEPQTQEGARWAGACPPCAGDKRRSGVGWIEIHVLQLDADNTRVYVQAF